ncbi:hypothetical protein [Luteimonas aquatica]|uniref:hypothetical protein n=1 Tax=Luteimonas aquatica TaxID=450364 RepID=UPI001F59EE5A|nr:hypothetical protein [Luteimonas aquatica]
MLASSSPTEIATMLQINMSQIKKIVLAGSLCLCAGSALAASADESGCVALGQTRAVSAFGTQHALVRDNDAYYKLGFRGGGCDALTLASRVEVSTPDGRLCPKSSVVTTKRGSCEVMKIESIDQKTYERLRRRR